MQKIPRYNNQFQQQQPAMVQHREPKRKKHFRWGIIVIPLMILPIVWFINGIEPAGTWEDFLDYIGIDNNVRFSMFACLGLAIVAIVAVARILRDSKKEGD